MQTTTTTPRDTGAVVAALASLVRAARTAGRLRHDQLGASGTRLTLLKTLTRAQEPMRPGDLAVIAEVAPSVVSRALARLEEDGLVSRRQDPDDARACRMTATPAGTEAVATIHAEYARLLHDSLSEMDDADIARLPVLLGQLEAGVARGGQHLPTHHHDLAPSLRPAPHDPHRTPKEHP